jgi:hypothetical protein
LYLEPLEDRLVLSAMHPAGGTREYSSPSKHSAAAASSSYASEYSTPRPSQEYGHTAKSSGDGTVDNYGPQPGTAKTYPADSSAAQDNYQQADNSVEPAAAPPATGEDAATRAAAAALLQTDRPAPGRPAGTATPPEGARPATPPAPVTVVARAPGGGGPTADAARAADQLPAAGAAPPASAPPPETVLPGPAESESDAGLPVDDALEATAAAEAPAPRYLPEMVGLVAGTLPVDLPALQRGAEQFFTRLAELGEDVPAGSVLARLAPWLGAGVAATAGLELARYTMRKQTPRRPGPAVRPIPDDA